MSVVSYVIDSTVQEIGTICTKGTKVLRHFHIEISIPSPCVTLPLPQINYFYFRLQILSSTTNNIDSGGGGLTAFKQSCLINETVHKSAFYTSPSTAFCH